MKVTGKRFYQIIITLTITLPFVFASSSCNCSRYERSYKQVLSRKKRFLIFSKGSNVIHTSYFGKQVVSGFPTGFNWILELDMFFPLPYEPRVYSQAKDLLFGKTKVQSVKPPWLMEPKQPSYSTYKPVIAEQPVIVETIPFDHVHSAPEVWDTNQPEIYMPPSGWKDDVIENIKSQVEMKHRTWDPHNISKYHSNANWLHDNNFMKENPKNYYKSQYYKPRGRSMNDNNYIDPDSCWENIYAQKDRQELYEIIHAGFKKIGIDTTACLQRTICEVKHFLLPKGKSLLHDVFRVIFTYPLHMNDQWADASKSRNGKDCSEVYSKDCPMSILDFMLHSGHIF